MTLHQHNTAEVQESALVAFLDPEYTAHVHSSLHPTNLPLKPIAGNEPSANGASDNIAFMIDSFLSPQECQSLVEFAEKSGFRKEKFSLGSPDFPKSYVPDYRHSLRTEVTDPAFAAALFSRISKFIPTEHFFDRQVHPSIASSEGPSVPGVPRCKNMTPVALDPKIRFLKYEPGHQFLAHMDAEYEDTEGRLGLLTFQIYLNEGYQGGETSFVASESEPVLSEAMMTKLDASGDSMDMDEIQLPPLKRVHVYPGLGKALVFQRDLIHEAARVLEGVKYVIGIDVMFSPTSP